MTNKFFALHQQFVLVLISFILYYSINRRDKKRYSRVADQKLTSLAILPTHKHKDVDIDGLLPARTANVIKPSRFCYYVQKGHGVRENLVSVIVSTFLIFMFVDQLLLMDLFSQLHYLNNNVGLTAEYKSLKS